MINVALHILQVLEMEHEMMKMNSRHNSSDPLTLSRHNSKSTSWDWHPMHIVSLSPNGWKWKGWSRFDII